MKKKKGAISMTQSGVDEVNTDHVDLVDHHWSSLGLEESRSVCIQGQKSPIASRAGDKGGYSL
jgi:hypothetical protein